MSKASAIAIFLIEILAVVVFAAFYVDLRQSYRLAQADSKHLFEENIWYKKELMRTRAESDAKDKILNHLYDSFPQSRKHIETLYSNE